MCCRLCPCPTHLEVSVPAAAAAAAPACCAEELFPCFFLVYWFLGGRILSAVLLLLSAVCCVLSISFIFFLSARFSRWLPFVGYVGLKHTLLATLGRHGGGRRGPGTVIRQALDCFSASGRNFCWLRTHGRVVSGSGITSLARKRSPLLMSMCCDALVSVFGLGFGLTASCKLLCARWVSTFFCSPLRRQGRRLVFEIDNLKTLLRGQLHRLFDLPELFCGLVWGLAGGN